VTTRTTPASVEAPIFLRGDGLGVVNFGVPTDETLAILEGVLGPATGQTEGTMFRFYSWDEASLVVGFNEQSDYRDDDLESFVH
jgi:hypothetical protein